jgi:hypothetical protein
VFGKVTESYGCKCNSRLLLDYGFVLEENKENMALISLQLDPDVESYEEKIRLLGDR